MIMPRKYCFQLVLLTSFPVQCKDINQINKWDLRLISETIKSASKTTEQGCTGEHKIQSNICDGAFLWK